MSDTTKNKADNAAFLKTRDYFLGQSLKPSDKVPDLLTENRKIAVELAEQVMSFLDVIAKYFGIPTMDLAMAVLPEVSLQLEADGIREKAAARTYLDLKGAVPLADICKGTYAYPAPTLRCVAQEIQRRERRAQYAAHDPLLKRIFGGFDKTGSGDKPPEDTSDEEESGDTSGENIPEDTTQDDPSGV